MGKVNWFELHFQGEHEIAKTFPLDLLRGFELNTTLTVIRIIRPLPCFSSGIAEQALRFYATRNRFGPELTKASKSELPTILENVMQTDDLDSSDPACLSVVYDTLRNRDDWFDKLGIN